MDFEYSLHLESLTGVCVVGVWSEAKGNLPSEESLTSGLDHLDIQASQNGKGVVEYLTYRRARIRGLWMQP